MLVSSQQRYGPLSDQGAGAGGGVPAYAAAVSAQFLVDPAASPPVSGRVPRGSGGVCVCLSSGRWLVWRRKCAGALWWHLRMEKCGVCNCQSCATSSCRCPRTLGVEIVRETRVRMRMQLGAGRTVGVACVVCPNPEVSRLMSMGVSYGVT